MEDHLQNPGEVPDDLLVNLFLLKGKEDLVSKQVAISQTLFRQSPAHAASQIFRQIGAKFSPKEQRFLEHITRIYSGALRTSKLNPIYVYIIAMETTKVDGEEKVNFCTPFFFRKNPCEGVDERFRDFWTCFLRSMQEIGRTRRHLISLVNEVVRKFGDSMQCEEVDEDSDVGGDCSICLKDYPVGFQVIRLPCRHPFCTLCIILWLHQNGSCPLCRYRLIPESSSPMAW